MRIMLPVPARVLLATLCCLSLHTVAEADTARPTPPAAEPSVARAEALRERGYAAYDAGQFAEALRHFDEAYRLDPNDASILRLRGGTYMELGRCKEAIADFDAFEKQHHDIADFLLMGNVFNDRAYCHMELKDYVSAARDLEDQVRYKPDDDWAWATLGRAYGFLKRYEESEAALKRAIKLNPNDPYAHYQLGLVYMVSGRSRDAIPYLQTTVRLEPGNKDAKELLDAAVAETSAKPANAASSPGAAPAARGVPTAEPSVAALQGDCDRGSAKACFSLAEKYGTGEGVPKDEATSARLHEQACRGKFLLGCSVLGSLYASGQGVPASIERAMAIWRPACDAGEPNSCTLLGAMYELRRVPKDPATAAVYYQKGCDGGHAAGCTQLSKLYRSGFGVPQDATRADELWQLGCKRDSAACEQGQPPTGGAAAGTSQTSTPRPAPSSGRPSQEVCRRMLLDEIGVVGVDAARAAIQARFREVATGTVPNTQNLRLEARSSACGDDPRGNPVLYDFDAGGVLRAITMVWARPPGPAPAPIFTERARLLAMWYPQGLTQSKDRLEGQSAERRVVLQDMPGQGVLLESYAK